MSASPTSRPDRTQLEDELRELRQYGVHDLRLALRSQLVMLARAVVTGGNDAEKVETVLHLAAERLSVPRYAKAAACLFGLTEETRRLTHKARRERARKYSGGTPGSFSSKTQNRICADLTDRLIVIHSERFAAGSPVKARKRDSISEPSSREPSEDTALDPVGKVLDATDCFDPCHRGEEHLTRELATTEGNHAHTWWHSGSSDWFGSFFAFWRMTITTPCEEIHYEYNQGKYDSARFGVDAPDGDNPKAVVVAADPLMSDNPRKTLHCGITNWNFVTHGLKLTPTCCLPVVPSPPFLV